MSVATHTVPRSPGSGALGALLHAGYVVSVILSSVLTSLGLLATIGLRRVSAARS